MDIYLKFCDIPKLLTISYWLETSPLCNNLPTEFFPLIDEAMFMLSRSDLLLWLVSLLKIKKHSPNEKYSMQEKKSCKNGGK